MHVPAVDRNAQSPIGVANVARQWLLRVDFSERNAALLDLYMLQGLPGVGPALANRLLVHFGSVERVITADHGALVQIRGIGPKKAQRIRNVVS